ncbi:hypothetical protein GCK72_022324 [Caenorhabditis remanei]|uniref:Uncharacterized protein n=1 Tax=Caenorhabditis remanei TaxID=31234 RepID=A0A6A5FTG4_CAERE|nr:hypothetical protein GCK72_022324 [Caenorhabditis remanei]KAF1745877.1 hypothetical protein GCK72_022324 [Caenorhabditis remanei]
MPNLNELVAEFLINDAKLTQFTRNLIENYEKLRLELINKDREIKDKREKIRRLEAEVARIRNVKYKVANVITTHPTPINQSCFYNALVISANTPLAEEDQVQYPLIKSVNWLYAPKLGVVSAINMRERLEPQEKGEDKENEIETKLGQWCSFLVEDLRTDEELRSFTKLSFNSLVVKDLSVTEPCRTILTVLEIETSKLFEEAAVYLEDEFLNKINFPANLRKKLFDCKMQQFKVFQKLSPQYLLKDQQYLLKLKVKIVLRENWQELFVHDQNWALFEVEHVCCAAVNSRVIFFS